MSHIRNATTLIRWIYPTALSRHLATVLESFQQVRNLQEAKTMNKGVLDWIDIMKLSNHITNWKSPQTKTRRCCLRVALKVPTCAKQSKSATMSTTCTWKTIMALMASRSGTFSELRIHERTKCTASTLSTSWNPIRITIRAWSH